MEPYEINSESDKLLELSTKIVVAYIGNNTTNSELLPEIINTVHYTLKDLHNKGAVTNNGNLKPAVPIKKSITDEYIVCLEDGKRLKMMKRYLQSRYNMTPQEYRIKWGLPADYPMVSPNYAERRSNFAKINGLGRKK